MMKCYRMFLLIVIIAILTGCNQQYSNWRQIAIEHSGVISVPPDWKVYLYENNIYFSNKSLEENNYTIYAFQYDGYKNYGGIASQSLFAELSEGECINSTVLSNGAEWGRRKYSYHNKEIERYFLTLYYGAEYSNGIVFVVWDDSITEKTVKEIAKSYRYENLIFPNEVKMQ